MPDTTTSPIAAGSWAVDTTHSRIGFVARHMMVTKVRGHFTDYTTTVTITDDPLQSRIEAVVQMASIDTANPERDGHLRTNDFFDVQTFPTMTFTSTGIEATASGYSLHGDLTIKGVTQAVTFDLEFEGVNGDPWGGTRAGFSAVAQIDRSDFGVSFNAPLETGGVLVGNKVTIELDIQLVKAS